MAWLRVDDGMTEHRKVLALPRKDRWTWMELLTYVARQNNGGHVPEGVCDVLRWVTPTFLKTCASVGLLDKNGDGFEVHDWDDYNPKDPTKAERQARWRAKKREFVDADVDGNVDEPVDADVDTPTRAGARDPSPTPYVSTSSSALKDAPEPHDDESIRNRLEAAGWSDGRIAIIAARGNLDLADQWLQAAQADTAVDNPGAYAFTMTESGTKPPTFRERQSTLAPGAVGTRSTSPPLPERKPEPEPEPAPPPADFLALAGHTTRTEPPAPPPSRARVNPTPKESPA